MDWRVLLIALSVSSVALGQDDDVATRCPNGLSYTSAMKLFHNTCYQFVSVEKYWHQARDHCLMNGGRLVNINNYQTNQFIVDSLNQLPWRNRGVWIGLHDIGSEMNWQWTGYELHENGDVVWTNWGRGHPGGLFHSRRDCVRMVRNDGWRWHETFCNSLRWHYRFICEYTAINSSQHTSDSLINIQIHSPASASRVLESINEDEQSWLNDEANGEAERQLNELRTENDAEKDRHGNGILVVSVGCVLVATLVVVALFMYYRRRRRTRRQRSESIESRRDVKGKDFDPDIIGSEDSIRTRAVANIYVDSDAKGHVTTRLASNPEPEVEDEEDYDDYDDEDSDDDEGEQEQEARRNTSNKGSTGSNGVESMPIHVYAEIQEENGDFPESSHVYEALEDVKK